jgi:transcriptional regulator with XRE-family HTH domain
VAELMGVSVGWYRSFESGRAVRVSPQFVARLSNVLRLTAAEQRFIFRLAILELYVIGDRIKRRLQRLRGVPCAAQVQQAVDS